MWLRELMCIHQAHLWQWSWSLHAPLSHGSGWYRRSWWWSVLVWASKQWCVCCKWLIRSTESCRKAQHLEYKLNSLSTKMPEKLNTEKSRCLHCVQLKRDDSETGLHNIVVVQDSVTCVTICPGLFFFWDTFSVKDLKLLQQCNPQYPKIYFWWAAMCQLSIMDGWKIQSNATRLHY